MIAQDGVGLRRGNLANVHVPPADFATVRLQLDRRFLEQGQLAIPKVLQPRVVDDQLVVEINGDSLANLKNAERIPLAEGLVCEDKRIFARGAGAVVPKAAATLVRTQVPFAALLGIVPDLHL